MPYPGARRRAHTSHSQEFKEKYADYGKDRRSAIAFHVEKISSMLKPTTTTVVALRAVETSTPAGPDVPAESTDTETASEKKVRGVIVDCE